jgi:hypothetical protein
MGLVRADRILSNARRSDLASVSVSALADTDALHLCIPGVALQLQLEEQEKRDVTAVVGTKRRISYLGPLIVRSANRACFTGAVVLGKEILRGAGAMDELDLVVRPSMHEVIPNPLNPNIPASIAMGARG